VSAVRKEEVAFKTPKLRWEEQIEEETARVGCNGWKVITARRDEWKILLKNAKASPGL
jgi:hypothetical protein